MVTYLRILFRHYMAYIRACSSACPALVLCLLFNSSFCRSREISTPAWCLRCPTWRTWWMCWHLGNGSRKTYRFPAGRRLLWLHCVRRKRCWIVSKMTCLLFYFFPELFFRWLATLAPSSNWAFVAWRNAREVSAFTRSLRHLWIIFTTPLKDF